MHCHQKEIAIPEARSGDRSPLTFSPSLKKVVKSNLIERFSGNLRSRVEGITDALPNDQLGYQTHGRTAHSQVVSAASLAVIAAIGSHSTGRAGA